MKHLKLTNTYFQDTLVAFSKRKTDEGKSNSHITSVSNTAKEFLYFIEGHQVTDFHQITQEHIDTYFEYLKTRKNQRKLGGLSSSYIRKHREGVLRFMEYVLGVGIGQTPFFIYKEKKELHPKDILTESEVLELFNQTLPNMDGIRTKAILSLLYGCGLRKGELHQLNVMDINMSKQVIRIQKSKTAKQRDVPMTATIQENLEQYLYGVREFYLDQQSIEEAFLVNNLGKRMSLEGIHHKIKKLASQTNITKPVTAHRLRHAIATHLLGDFSIEEIALFLGHSNIDSSQIYTHIKFTKAPQTHD